MVKVRNIYLNKTHSTHTGKYMYIFIHVSTCTYSFVITTLNSMEVVEVETNRGKRSIICDGEEKGVSFVTARRKGVSFVTARRKEYHL